MRRPKSELLILAMVSCAMPAAATDPPTVEIFLPAVIDFHAAQAFGRARWIVRDAYEQIGVQVVWRVGKTAPLGCLKKPGLRQIIVTFRTGAVKGRSDSALAFANPHLQEGPCVTLLADRLKSQIGQNPAAAGILLGHVLAHEIGHVLQGVERHSESGMMKQRWSPRDISDMSRTGLRFTDYDRDLILDPFRQAPFGPRLD